MRPAIKIRFASPVFVARSVTLPPSCLVADPLSVIRRKQSTRRPSNRPVMRLASLLFPPCPRRGICVEGSPLVCSLRLECRPSGAPLTVSGVLFGVRSLRPFTALSAPTGSASRELRFAQYPALHRPSQRFVWASLGLTACARSCHAACKIGRRLHANSSATPPSQTSSAALWTASFLIEGLVCLFRLLRPRMPN